MITLIPVIVIIIIYKTFIERSVIKENFIAIVVKLIIRILIWIVIIRKIKRKLWKKSVVIKIIIINKYNSEREYHHE